MLRIHPFLLEEISKLLDEYVELEHKDRQVVRAIIARPHELCIAQWNAPHILGGTQHPHLPTFKTLMDELQITYAVRSTYIAEDKPHVTYWVRVGTGTK